MVTAPSFQVPNHMSAAIARALMVTVMAAFSSALNGMMESQLNAVT